MNIETANKNVIKIEKRVNDLLNKKEIELLNVLPKVSQIKKDKVFTSRTENNQYLYYIYSVEKYDKEIDLLEKIKASLIKYIDSELIRLNKYKRFEELIVYYRENKRKKYNWEDISNLVGLSQTHCRRIYREYKNIRCI